jgi:transposase InsO family protein
MGVNIKEELLYHSVHNGPGKAYRIIHYVQWQHRSLLSTTLRVLHDRAEVSQGDSRGRDTLADRCLGGPTTARSHPPRGKHRNISFVITIPHLGPARARVARTSGITLLTTPYHAPRANAICERFLRSVRQECLDHLLIVKERQLQRVLHAYVSYFNQVRPHQGIAQQIPEPSRSALSIHQADEQVIAFPLMGGTAP